MSWNLRSKDEIKSAIAALRQAVDDVASISPAPSPESPDHLTAYLAGFHAGLDAVAAALDAEREPPMISLALPQTEARALQPYAGTVIPRPK